MTLKEQMEALHKVIEHQKNQEEKSSNENLLLAIKELQSQIENSKVETSQKILDQEERLKSEFNEQTNTKEKLLTWEGTNGAVIQLFYDLKRMRTEEGKPLIRTTNEKLAKFIKENFLPDTAISTIQGQFSDRKSPKKEEHLIYVNWKNQ